MKKMLIVVGLVTLSGCVLQPVDTGPTTTAPTTTAPAQSAPPAQDVGVCVDAQGNFAACE